MIEDTLKLVKGNYKKIIVQVEILQKVEAHKPVVYHRRVELFFQAEDGIRDVERSRGLGDVYKRQPPPFSV